MADQVVSRADLSAIERNLNLIFQQLDVVNGNVATVDNNVRVIYDEVGALANEFKAFIQLYEQKEALALAETRLIKIRQELETKFGHYAEVRRTTTGILQADDLGIIKKETISTATEELMISTPDYWMAPCLVALAAWINDQPELAEKALKEGIRRDDEKTSLLFALICRRADRKKACLKWTQRYLANQDEENLDRKCIIILDAFASGLLGVDSEGIIARQMGDWLEYLSEKPGFIEQQTKQWSEQIKLKRKPLSASDYPYLKKYSHTWPLLEDVLEGAHLHAEIFNYLENIFNQQPSTEPIKKQLDDILISLVSDFDDEELPLRRDEQYNQLIVEFDGDVIRAKTNMEIEDSTFETHKNFTQLLTDAAMNPENSHASVSTQKFAIALSKEWMENAYNDVVAENRLKIPNEIEINVDTFNDKTTDGQNEDELIDKFNELVDQEKKTALDKLALSGFEQFSLYAGIGIAVIGLIMMITGNMLLGLIAAIGGAALVIFYFSKKNKVADDTEKTKKQFEEKRTQGTQIIRATLAEIVDFRIEFKTRDQESNKVTEYLEQISPEHYIRKLSDSTRRIKVSE